MFSAASFFSGIGAMDLSAVAAFEGKLDIRHMCEIDPYKRSILNKNRRYWKNVTIHKDIMEVKPDDIGNPDIIFGGFPCTEISNAGHRRGIEAGESALWYNLYDIISAIRPRAIVLENVPAILHRGGTTVLNQLTTIGYDGMWLTVPAYIFGSPQYRIRWFYVAYANSIGYESEEAVEVHQTQIGTHRIRQQVQVTNANLHTCKSRRRTGARKLHRGNQPQMINLAARNARKLVTKHQFPSGAWQDQKADEPPRLAPETPTWASEVESLGDIALPQQSYPIFKALYQFLINHP